MEFTPLPTDARVRAFLIYSIAVTVGMFVVFILQVPRGAPRLAACKAAAWHETPVVTNPAEMRAWTETYGRCSAPVIRQQGLLMLVAGGVAPGFVVYFAKSGFRVRRRRHQPMSSLPQGPQIQQAVAELSAEAELDRIPTVYFDPTPDASPVAFGTVGQPCLALGTSALDDFAGSRDRFDAKVRHELAHLRMNDIRRYHLVSGSWWQVVVTSLIVVPLVLWKNPLFFGEAPLALRLLVQFIVLLGVSFLLLRDFVREREVYADFYSARRSGTATVQAALSSMSARPSSFALLRTHPTTAQRIAALDQPATALRSRPWTSFVVGGLVGVFVPTLAWLLARLAAGTWVETYSLPVAGVVGGSLLARALAVSSWRNVHVGLLGGRRLAGGVVMGGLSGAGLLLGGMLPFHVALLGVNEAIPLSWPIALGVPITFAAFGGWASACARARLTKVYESAGGREYRTGLRAAVLIGAVVGAAWYTIAARLSARRLLMGLTPADGLPTGHQLPSESDMIRQFAVDVSHHWLSFVVLAVAVATYLLLRLQGWAAASVAERPGTVPAPVAPPPPATEPKDSAIRLAPTAVVSAEQTTVSARPPLSRIRVMIASLVMLTGVSLATGPHWKLLALAVCGLVAVTMAYASDRDVRTPAAVVALAWLCTAGSVTGYGLATDRTYLIGLFVGVGLLSYLYSALGAVSIGNRHVNALIFAPLVITGSPGAVLVGGLTFPVLGIVFLVVLYAGHRHDDVTFSRPAGIATSWALGAIGAMVVGATLSGW